MPQYTFRAWAPPISAQEAGEELERLRAAHDGMLRASDVVKAARRPTSPLHAAFEWDDALAAAQYRLDQARALIRSVRVVTGDSDLPAFLHVRPETIGPGYYQSVGVIVQRPDEFALALREVQGLVASAQQALIDMETLQAVQTKPGRKQRVKAATRAATKTTQLVEAIT